MSWHGAPQKRLLLTSDRDTQNSQDSAFSSHIMSSQIQDSQCSDFSQIATQDMFSQSNSGPLTDSITQQQGMKKMSMYEKWLSKRAMFKRDPPPHLSSVDNKKVNAQVMPVNSTNTTVQAQGYFGTGANNNSMTRPIVDTSLRGSERELLKQVTFAIHDCSSEMKSALFTVKEKLENVTDMSNEQLAQTLTSFLDDIWKHQEKLQQLLQEQDKGRSMIGDLEVKLAKKESQIAMLEEQLVQARKNDTSRFAKAVRCEMQSPQMVLQSKLGEMLEWTKDTTEQQGHHFKEYKHSMEEQCKQIQSELRKIPDKLEFKQRELHNQLTDDVKNCLEIYNGDFEEMIKNLIQQCFNQQLRGSEETITSLQKGSIQDILKTQLEVISRKLGDVMKSHTVKNNEQFTNVHGALSGNMKQIKDLLHYKSLETDTLARLEDRLGKFQSSIAQQLGRIESRYLGEIKELGDEFYKQMRCSANKEVTAGCENLRDGSNIYLNPVCIEGANSGFTSSNLLANQIRNNSQLASVCAKSKQNASTSASKKGSSNDHCNNHVLHKQLQTSRQDFNKYNKQIAEITHSKMNDVHTNSARQVGNLKNHTNVAQVAKAPVNFLDQHAAYCHAFAKREEPFTSKVTPTVPSQMPKSNKKITTKKCSPSAHHESSAISPQQKKKGGKKRTASSKKNMSTKYVENLTVIHTQKGGSSQTGVWTRSHYKSVKQVQAAAQRDFLRASDSCQFMDDNKYSWPKTEARTTGHGNTKRDASVYNFDEPDTGNQPVYSRKRDHASGEATGNLSLASFISNRCAERGKNQNFERCSEGSSPTISITEVTIRRKVRTPFRRHLNKDGLYRSELDNVDRYSSVPTILSDMGSRH